MTEPITSLPAAVAALGALPMPAGPVRLTPEREAEIAERAEAATPGPWETHSEYGQHFYAYLGGPYLRGVGTLNFGEGDDAEADKALTVNAREDIRALLAELAAVRKERDEARDRILHEAIEAARGEYLNDDTRTPEDEAYNQAVSDVVAAIGALLEGGESR